MRNSPREKFDRWKLDELLQAHPGLAIRPVMNGVVQLRGELSFSAEASGKERIDDAYEVEITVPSDFPRELPLVVETTGRVPKDFHTNDDGSLCLGSPVRQRLNLSKQPTLLGFVNSCLIPYLYGFTYREKNGSLPFGELDHGMRGIRKDFADLFGVQDPKAAEQMVCLAGMKRRNANKRPCPCGSGLRLGKCHNRRVNHLRRQLGRTWFRDQYHWLTGK